MGDLCPLGTPWSMGNLKMDAQTESPSRHHPRRERNNEKKEWSGGRREGKTWKSNAPNPRYGESHEYCNVTRKEGTCTRSRLPSFVRRKKYPEEKKLMRGSGLQSHEKELMGRGANDATTNT